MAWKTTRPSLLNRVRDPEDQVAWAEFDGRYGELILRYCRSRGLQASDAEDVRQMVLLNLSRSMPRFIYAPERGRFRDYLGRSVRNAIARHMGRPSRRVRVLESDVLEYAANPVADDALWDDEWVRHHFRLAMRVIRETFDPRSVAVFDQLLSGRTTAHVARDAGLSEQAVHKIKQRIRNRLRSLIMSQVAREDRTDA